MATVFGMYLPSAFAEHDPAEIARIVDTYPLAQLVVVGPHGLVATPVPMLRFVDPASGALSFRGHLAKANPALVEGQAMLLFLGVDAYVSPSAYPSKFETGRVVPTWNYETVQVQGNLVLRPEPAWVLDIVRALTNVHESGRVRPWSVDDAPTDYIEGLLRAIVGIEVVPTSIVAKRKLSQNRSQADSAGVVADLAAGDALQQRASMAMTRILDGSSQPPLL